MLIVTGATGKLGAQIVERLLDRVPAESIGVSVRDVDKGVSLAARGVRVRHGDFTDPDSLAHAFEGADRVLVISAAIRGGGAVEANCAALDAARDAGASGILYTSHQAASLTSLFPPAVVHAQTETHLASLGVPFTALRNGFYADSLLYQIGDALESGTISGPQDGPVSWTAHADLAEVAAQALTQETMRPGITPPLTAPETFDLAGAAELLSDLTGRNIERVLVGDEDWKSSMVNGGLPPPVVDFMFGQYLAARAGEFAVTDPTLVDLLGHPATPLRTTLEAYAAHR